MNCFLTLCSFRTSFLGFPIPHAPLRKKLHSANIGLSQSSQKNARIVTASFEAKTRCKFQDQSAIVCLSER